MMRCSLLNCDLKSERKISDNLCRKHYILVYHTPIVSTKIYKLNMHITSFQLQKIIFYVEQNIQSIRYMCPINFCNNPCKLNGIPCGTHLRLYYSLTSINHTNTILFINIIQNNVRGYTHGM